MTPATPTTFPSDWTTSTDGTVVTAPDGNTAQGDVLNLFKTTFAQVDTLAAQVAALTPPDTDNGPTQAAFDSLSAEVDTLKTEVDTITKTLDTFAAAITATEPAPATA